MKSKKKFQEKMYANKIYNKIIGEDIKDEFVKKTKRLIYEGDYLKAIKNLKILYYEKGLNTKVDNYYDEKIDANKINLDFLENQKLLLKDFFGKYNGIMSMFFLNALYSIAVPLFVSVSTIVFTTTMTNDYKSEVLKQYVYDKIVLHKAVFNDEYFTSIIRSNNIDIIVKSVIVIVPMFIITFILVKKIHKILRKERFYKLCLQAVQELLKDKEEHCNVRQDHS